MRLRREVGDFTFEVKNGAATIPKNLFPEQLIGQIVNAGSGYVAITAVEGANGDATYGLTAGAGELTLSLTYTVATGEVALVTEG